MSSIEKQIERTERDINIAKYDQELALYKLADYLMSTREVNDLPADIQRALIDVTLRRDTINKLTVFKTNLEVEAALTP